MTTNPMNLAHLAREHGWEELLNSSDVKYAVTTRNEDQQHVGTILYPGHPTFTLNEMLEMGVVKCGPSCCMADIGDGTLRLWNERQRLEKIYSLAKRLGLVEMLLTSYEVSFDAAKLQMKYLRQEMRLHAKSANWACAEQVLQFGRLDEDLQEKAARALASLQALFTRETVIARELEKWRAERTFDLPGLDETRVTVAVPRLYALTSEAREFMTEMTTAKSEVSAVAVMPMWAAVEVCKDVVKSRVTDYVPVQMIAVDPNEEELTRAFRSWSGAQAPEIWPFRDILQEAMA